MKVEYIAMDGYLSKAYLDNQLEENTYSGTNKYTDEHVTVTWDGEVWREIEYGQ